MPAIATAENHGSSVGGDRRAPAYFPYPEAAGEDARVLIVLSRALALLQTLNRNMTLEQAQVFLMVALDEGRAHMDYAEMCGLGRPTVTRILTDLTHYRRTRKGAEEGGGVFTRTEGYGLLEQRVNPAEQRQRIVFLSPKGHVLASRLARVVREGAA